MEQAWPLSPRPLLPGHETGQGWPVLFDVRCEVPRWQRGRIPGDLSDALVLLSAKVGLKVSLSVTSHWGWEVFRDAGKVQGTEG